MSQFKIFTGDQLTDTMAVLIGTRPSIVKMAPIIRELESRDLPSITIHAGQHYSHIMDRAFFEDLEIRPPDYQVEGIQEHTLHGAQTGEMLKGIEQALIAARPSLLFVCGDANFNLAGALAARKLHIQVAHTESGLRSLDWSMPEEHNRVMIDHISEYLFAPTERSKDNLLAEKVRGRIEVVGNTVVDAVFQHLKISASKSSVIGDLDLEKGEYFLVTSHREENVDNIDRFTSLLRSLAAVAEEHEIPVIYPIHPRSRKRLDEMDLWDIIRQNELIRIVDPVSYLDFLQLISNARGILTDSGGIQEEACILGVPCVTIRDNTERPETVEVGSNIVAGVEPQSVVQALNKLLGSPTDWHNPYGEGDTSQRIVDTVLDGNGSLDNPA